MDKYFECGCCGHYHRVGFTGDCREDSERFTWMELEDAGVDDVNIQELNMESEVW